ncbi:MAG TPA: hypothetical protein VMG39_10370 [Pseudolabrys sp.]|nr:hypothetical protein [Pseudolabrys sp.]
MRSAEEKTDRMPTFIRQKATSVRNICFEKMKKKQIFGASSAAALTRSPP